MNELLEMANEYGKDAMRNGQSPAPFRDKNVMRIVAENNTKFEFGWTSALFDAWQKGYHAMILGDKL